jgi:hypothetical protein
MAALTVAAGTASVYAQSDAPETPVASAPAVNPETDGSDVSSSLRFATLGGVEAVPMAPAELDAVKGLHIHFLDANGGFHLAGNPENEGIGTGNWYLNGSPDGQPVHPSYHGLCVAGPITIPPVPPNFLSQCP